MKRILPLMILILTASLTHAQGFLPQASTTTVAATETTHPLLIGETIPESVAVIDSDGKERTLLSYKSPTELLVVTFLSARCQTEQSLWPALRRLNNHYKDWRVSFVAATASPTELLPELAHALEREKLPWPVVQDNHRKAAWLKITKTPEVLILDEYGVLKYRGPVANVKKALDTVIGHIDAVQEPEPPMVEGCAP